MKRLAAIGLVVTALLVPETGLTQRGKELRSIPAPGTTPAGVAFEGKALWTVDGRNRMAYRVDPATGAVDHRIEIEAATARGLAWHDGHLVVSDDRKDLIHEVDPDDGTTLRTIPTPAKGVTGMAPSSVSEPQLEPAATRNDATSQDAPCNLPLMVHLPVD
jgi:sugar lactone lactonase YvrE